jgi:hypothetical protein
LASAEKIDLFVSQIDDFSISKLDRRISYELLIGDRIWVYSPEDIILQKLVWGGGDRSKKQWRDVLGVIKVRQSKLDFTYLRQWAEKLDIVEYLDRSLTAAGI